MRKLQMLFMVALIAAPVTAIAQQSRIEVFGGYSHLSDDIGPINQPFTLCIPEATNCPPPFGKGVGLNGWQASVTENVTGWFGVTEEFAGHHGTHSASSFRVKNFSFLAGPRLAYPRAKPFKPFVHALFGYGSTKFSDTVGSTTKDDSFAWALGGGLDLKVGRRVGIRLFQTDYYRTKVFAATQNDFRVSTGVVFRFGK